MFRLCGQLWAKVLLRWKHLHHLPSNLHQFRTWCWDDTVVAHCHSGCTCSCTWFVVGQLTLYSQKRFLNFLAKLSDNPIQKHFKLYRAMTTVVAPQKWKKVNTSQGFELKPLCKAAIVPALCVGGGEVPQPVHLDHHAARLLLLASQWVWDGWRQSGGAGSKAPVEGGEKLAWLFVRAPGPIEIQSLEW